MGRIRSWLGTAQNFLAAGVAAFCLAYLIYLNIVPSCAGSQTITYRPDPHHSNFVVHAGMGLNAMGWPTNWCVWVEGEGRTWRDGEIRISGLLADGGAALALAIMCYLVVFVLITRVLPGIRKRGENNTK